MKHIVGGRAAKNAKAMVANNGRVSGTGEYLL